MTKFLQKHAGVVTMLVVILGFRSVASAQTSIVVEVRVLELSRKDLEAMGGTVTSGFAKPLTKSLADSLTTGPLSRVVHRIELPATSEASAQVRLDSRIPVTSSSSADIPAFFDAGIVMDVTPKVFQSRDISLATASQVRIRRGPDAAGTSLVVFENPFAKFDTRIREGESIILGGFITAAERMTLPEMPMLADNPILNYLYPKVPNPQDRTEIAILLTPRIVGMLINPAVDAPVIVSGPAVVNPAALLLAPSAASSLAAATSPTVTAPEPSITSALPAGSKGATASAPVVTSPPIIAGATAADVKPRAAPTVVVSTPSTPDSTAVAVRRPPLVDAPQVVAGTSGPSIANMPEVEGTGGRYTVQVGAFDQLEKAESLRSELAKNYDMVFVEKVGTSKTPYRVRVGRFSDMQSARKIEKQLSGDGLDTYVTTLN
jgi:cell division septation protein DedD